METFSKSMKGGAGECETAESAAPCSATTWEICAAADAFAISSSATEVGDASSSSSSWRDGMGGSEIPSVSGRGASLTFLAYLSQAACGVCSFCVDSVDLHQFVRSIGAPVPEHRGQTGGMTTLAALDEAFYRHDIQIGPKLCGDSQPGPVAGRIAAFETLRNQTQNVAVQHHRK